MYDFMTFLGGFFFGIAIMLVVIGNSIRHQPRYTTGEAGDDDAK